MANQEHLARLQEGSGAWNKWRKENPDTVPDLSWAELQGLDLSKTNLGRAYLREAKLDKANLRSAILWKADLGGAHLNSTDLRQANLRKANLFEAKLIGANLQRANLTGTLLVDTKLQQADLTGCFVYGCSVWNVELEGATQLDLNLLDAHSSSNEWEPALVNQSAITVDHLEVAQFIYLLQANQKMRDVIDTVTSKVVLILGRFKRKAVLDAIRKDLGQRNYVPILFDFEKSPSLNFTETITLLARMARFIIADLTEPSSIPHELQAIVPHVAVPVQPILEGEHPYSMFGDFAIYDWVLKLHRYNGIEGLLASLEEMVIAPAEAMRKLMVERKNRPLE
jgi:hypothetical protein